MNGWSNRGAIRINLSLLSENRVLVHRLALSLIYSLALLALHWHTLILIHILAFLLLNSLDNLLGNILAHLLVNSSALILSNYLLNSVALCLSCSFALGCVDLLGHINSHSVALLVRNLAALLLNNSAHLSVVHNFVHINALGHINCLALLLNLLDLFNCALCVGDVTAVRLGGDLALFLLNYGTFVLGNSLVFGGALLFIDGVALVLDDSPALVFVDSVADLVVLGGVRGLTLLLVYYVAPWHGQRLAFLVLIWRAHSSCGRPALLLTLGLQETFR